MDNSDKKIKKALRSFGFNFPTTEDEVEAFEKSIEGQDISVPPMEDNPTNILKKGITTKINLSKGLEVDAKAAKNLAMAAREGKGISSTVRKKMDEDRKNAQPKD
jgi:hypothetical protein